MQLKPGPYRPRRRATRRHAPCNTRTCTAATRRIAHRHCGLGASVAGLTWRVPASRVRVCRACARARCSYLLLLTWRTRGAASCRSSRTSPRRSSAGSRAHSAAQMPPARSATRLPRRSADVTGRSAPSRACARTRAAVLCGAARGVTLPAQLPGVLPLAARAPLRAAADRVLPGASRGERSGAGRQRADARHARARCATHARVSVRLRLRARALPRTRTRARAHAHAHTHTHASYTPHGSAAQRAPLAARAKGRTGPVRAGQVLAGIISRVPQARTAGACGL
jgi:hypothetical protein